MIIKMILIIHYVGTFLLGTFFISINDNVKYIIEYLIKQSIIKSKFEQKI